MKKLKLANGENMPTLKDYLKRAESLKVHLILEVKTHKDINRQNAAIDATLKLVKKYNMTDRITYIAFSLDAVKELIAKVPHNTEVYYLNGDLSPKELKTIGCSGPDYSKGVFKKHPEWISECHSLGMKTNVWTVNNSEDMKYFLGLGVDYITTNEPVMLQKLIAK